MGRSRWWWCSVGGWGAVALVAGCASSGGHVERSARPARLGLGDSHVCALTQEGELYCWGHHHAGQLGPVGLPWRDAQGRGTHVAWPRRVMLVEDAAAAPLVALVVDGDRTCVRDAEDHVRCFGEGAAEVTERVLEPQAWPQVRDVVERVEALGWGCELRAGEPERVVCWADAERAWRLDDDAFVRVRDLEREYALGLECPAEARANLSTEAWRCLDARGAEQGLARLFWPDGSVRAVGRYVDGQRQGEWVERDASGRLRSEGRYVDGERDGVWRTVRVSLAGEALEAERAWRAGVPAGTWSLEGGARSITFDAAGEPVAWSSVSHGVGQWFLGRDGSGRWWREDRADDGTVIGRAEVSEPGQRPLWDLDASGVAPHGHRFIGAFEALDPDAGVRIVGHFLEDGRADGVWEVTRVDSGLPVLSASFVDGVPHGPWRRHHVDGPLAAEVEMVEGRAHGPWSAWHASGEQAAEGHFEHGVMVGRWRWWSAQGALVAEESLARPTAELSALSSRLDPYSGAVSASVGTLEPCARAVGGDADEPCLRLSSVPVRGANLVDELEGLLEVAPVVEARR